MKVEKIENCSEVLSDTNTNYITLSGDYLEVKKYPSKPHPNVINLSNHKNPYGVHIPCSKLTHIDVCLLIKNALIKGQF